MLQRPLSTRQTRKIILTALQQLKIHLQDPRLEPQQQRLQQQQKPLQDQEELLERLKQKPYLNQARDQAQDQALDKEEEQADQVKEDHLQVVHLHLKRLLPRQPLSLRLIQAVPQVEAQVEAEEMIISLSQQKILARIAVLRLKLVR